MVDKTNGIIEEKRKKTDYSFCENFNILITDGIKHKMITCSGIVNAEYDVTRKQIEDEFVRLDDFLDSAKYIGRKFRRTANIKNTNDKSYQNVDDNNNYIVVLYATDYAMLVRRENEYDRNEIKKFIG